MDSKLTYFFSIYLRNFFYFNNKFYVWRNGVTIYVIMNMEEVWKRVRKPWFNSRCLSEIHLERKRNPQNERNRLEDKRHIFEAVNYRTRNYSYYPCCDIIRKTIIIGCFIYRCYNNPLRVRVSLEQSNSYNLLDRVSGLHEFDISRIFKLMEHEGGKFFSLTHLPPLAARIYTWYSFLLEAEFIPRP
jgi:hypothetical protein